MRHDQQELIDRVRRRAASRIDQGKQEIPIFPEEEQAMCEAGLLKPDQELYRFLIIKRLKG